jgi:hypothetical protein
MCNYSADNEPITVFKEENTYHNFFPPLLLEATSAWLAVAVVRQRQAGLVTLVAIRAKRRASIFILFVCFQAFVERRDYQISSSCFCREGEK